MYNKGIGSRETLRVVLAFVCLVGALVSARAQNRTFTRADLARSASFTVTETLAPKGSAKVVRVFRFEVKGSQARVDLNDPTVGQMRYLANDHFLWIYTPGNGSAVKQEFSGGVEKAFEQAFADANEKLSRAKRTGSAIVSGQPTDIYRDPKTQATIYLGKGPGFKLPVRTEESNAGGTSLLLVTNIRLNPALADSDFALPKGTQIVDGGGTSAGH